MSQGYAERRFPDPVQLSPENPGRLVPATMGFLPGALPGRGGGGARDVPAQAAPLPLGANGKPIIRETVPASAANLPSHLRNGLPFGGLGQPLGQPAPEHTPLPVAAPAPIAAPPAFVAPPSAAEVAPPPRVLTPPPGLVDIALAAGPSVTPEVPVVGGGDAAVAVVPPAVVAPPPMVGAPPSPALVAAPPTALIAPAVVAPAPGALPPGMAVTPPMGVAGAEPAAPPPAAGEPAGYGAAPNAAAGPAVPEGAAAPDASASPWLREAGAIPIAPAPVYRPEPPPEARPQPPTVSAPSGGGKGVFVVIGLVVVAALGGVLYFLRDDVKKAMGQGGGSSGDTPVKLETPKDKAAATAKEPETTSAAPVLPSAKPAPTSTVQVPPVTPGTGRLPLPTATAPKTADPQKPPPKFDPSGI